MSGSGGDRDEEESEADKQAADGDAAAEDRVADESAGMSPMARAMVEMSPYLGIGWMFVFSLGAFGWLGWWLDGKLGTAPWLLVGGSLFGIVVGFANLFKVVSRLDRRKNDKTRKGR